MIAKGGTAQFPDSRSERACAHLAELRALAERGDKAVMIFLVQRNDVRALRINRELDSAFTDAYDLALESGVEVMAVKHSISPKGFGLPVIIPILEL